MRRSRSTGRPDDLAQAAHRPRELGREGLGRPVGVDPDPDDRGGHPAVLHDRLPEDAADLGDRRRRDGRRGRSAISGRAGGRPSPRTSSTAVEHRQRDDRPQPPCVLRRKACWAEPGRTRGSPAPGGACHDLSRRPRPAVCSSATATQTSGTSSASQPRTTSCVDPTRSKRSSREIAGSSRTDGSSRLPPPPRSLAVLPRGGTCGGSPPQRRRDRPRR